MRSIKMFKRWSQWIVNVPRKSHLPRVRFQGSGQLRIDGFCDGLRVSASPDCAADISLVSPAFANRLDKSIDTSEECCIDLELPGNRIVRTAGMIRDVKWSFGDRNYSLDFYILEGLPTEVLLDKQFLDEANVFEDYAESFYDTEEVGKEFQDGLFLTLKRMNASDSYESAPRLSERLVALFRRQPPSSPQKDPRQDFYACEKHLIDQKRAINKSNMSADEKKAETDRIQEQMTLLQQSRPSNGNAGSTPNSQGQPALLEYE